jgi:hypothetical protein
MPCFSPTLSAETKRAEICFPFVCYRDDGPVQLPHRSSQIHAPLFLQHPDR